MTVTIRNSAPFTNSTWVDPNSRNVLVIHFLMKEWWTVVPLLCKQAEELWITSFTESKVLGDCNSVISWLKVFWG